MSDERREMMKGTRAWTERQGSELEIERMKDQGGEDRRGNHKRGRGEAEWNKVNKYCSLESDFRNKVRKMRGKKAHPENMKQECTRQAEKSRLGGSN